MILGCVSVSARSVAQNQRVSLNLRNCTVMQLFEEIQQQTRLFFFYDQKHFQGQNVLTVRADDEEVGGLLKRLVWMNARSRLVYPVAFGDTREVELEGEAYFEVTRDENRPFIVHAGQVAVKVLGTEFNVNTCRKQKVQTVLVKGSVQVENGGKREVVLRPGELAETVGTQIRVTQVNVRKYTAWREGVFYFEEAELEEIMTELADWYCVQAVFTDQTVRTRKFSGVLERSETIENVLKKIERTTSVHFTIQQGIIQVK